MLLYTCKWIEVNKILFTLTLPIVETHEMVILQTKDPIKKALFAMIKQSLRKEVLFNP